MPADQSDDPRDVPVGEPGRDPLGEPVGEQFDGPHDKAVRPHARGKEGGGWLARRHGVEPRTQRYFLLVCLLLIDIFVIALAGPGAIATFVYAPLTAAVLVLALRTSEAHRSTLRVAWVAAGLVVVLSAAVLLTGHTRLDGWVYLMLSALLVISPLAISRSIVTSRRVTLPLLVGAICVYLMIGLLFTFADLGLNGVHPSFFAQASSAAPIKEPSVFLYFSFITMTTVGYGDFTPASSVPRALCVFEAILGQVFLVTAVARLVSLYGLQRPEPEPAAGEPREEP